MRQIKNSFWIFLFAILLLSSCKKEGAISPDTAKINLEASIYDHDVFGTYEVGVPLTDENYLTLRLGVETPGKYYISTPVVNGYRFTGSGELKEPSVYTIKLKGEGTPLSEKIDRFRIVTLSDVDSADVYVVTNLSTKIIVATLTDGTYDSTYAITGKGKVLWQKSGDYKYNTVINGIVCSSYKNGLYAFDILTGQEVWSKSTFGSIGSMSTINNLLIVVNGYGDIQAIKPSDGTIVWTFNNPVSFFTGMAVQGEKIYFGSDGLYALNANGSQLWHSNNGVVSNSVPVPGGDKIYVLISDYLEAFDINTGTFLWKKYAVGSFGASNPVFSAGKIFVNGISKAYCFDATTGAPLWQYVLDNVHYAPFVYGNNVLLSGSGFTLMEAVNISTGLRSWTTNFFTPETKIIASDGIAYVGVVSNIYGIYLKTGEIIFALTKKLSFSPKSISVVYDKSSKTAVYPSPSN